MLYMTILASPLGYWQLVGSERGLRAVSLLGSNGARKLPDKHPEPVAKAAAELGEYFAGERTSFDLKLDFSGAPEFYRHVWDELRRVPYGHTTTYLDIAQKLGDRKAVRAVGQANKNNPLAIVVPCHRCIASNGELQGYFYGLDFKRKLLAMENPRAFAEQGKLFH